MEKKNIRGPSPLVFDLRVCQAQWCVLKDKGRKKRNATQRNATLLWASGELLCRVGIFPSFNFCCFLFSRSGLDQTTYTHSAITHLSVSSPHLTENLTEKRQLSVGPLCAGKRKKKRLI
jgi:hypothetical protein